jgi:VWFA-related protein
MRNLTLRTLFLAPVLAVFAASFPSAVVAQQEAAPPSPPASQAPAQTDSQTSPAAPQQTPPPANGQPVPSGNGAFTIQRTARLVVLDVVVTDAKNNVVKDLKREDFHVEEAGQPQTILNFEQAGEHTPDPQVTIDSTADLDRLAPRAPVNIILLDEFNTRFEDMAFARYSLKKYLERQPGKLDTPTMLIAVDLQHFTVLRDYTQNKDEILSALDHHFVAFPWQVHQSAWVSERYATAFITLRRVAEAVIGHRGHKNMIWIGRGFPSLDFSNVPIDTQQRVDNAVQDCVNILRDARVTLYTIDPAGVMINPGEYGPDAALDDPFGGNYEFSRLAKATGGRTLYGRNDVDAEIKTSIQEGRSFYTLTYRPTNTSQDPQKFRKIVATVDRPGMKVITREGYYLQRGPGRVDPQNPSRRLVGDLLSADASTMVYDGVPITLQPSPTNPDSYTVHIDSKGLTWSNATDTEPRHADVILLVSTFDRKGKELDRVAKTITAKAPATVPPTGPLDRSLDIVYLLGHDPKAVRARFVVRVTTSGRIGTADAVLSQQAANHPPAP